VVSKRACGQTCQRSCGVKALLEKDVKTAPNNNKTLITVISLLQIQMHR
jgi:hypothetical protein